MTGSFRLVDFGFFEDQVGEPSAHASDGGEGVSDFDVTIDVGVLDTEDVLETVLVDDERHFWWLFFFESRKKKEQDNRTICGYVTNFCTVTRLIIICDTILIEVTKW